MLIVHLEPPSPCLQGDQLYRTVQPCHALAALEDTHVISGTWLSPMMHLAARNADVLILCQAVDADFLPLLTYRAQRDLPTIVEINDNFTAPQPWHDVASFYSNPVNRSLLLQLAHDASGLQFSSSGLQQRFGQLNDAYATWPNQLWDAAPALARRKRPVRIGWAGSLGHRDDITWALPALRTLMARERHAELAIMAPPQLHALFDWAPRERLILRPPGDLAHYRAFLSHLHIAIAPLIANDFNQCRSDIKFLEYSQAGAVAVCSAIPPYTHSIRHGENGFLFATVDDLCRQLEYLIRCPDVRVEVAANAHADVAAGRLEALHAASRRRWYAAIAAGRAPMRRGAAARFTALRLANRSPYTQPHPRYLQIRFGALETALYNGLLSVTDTAQRWTDLRQAAALQPDFYLSHLYLGQALGNRPLAQATLQHAAHLAPRSVLALFLLGENALAAANPEVATDAWRRCVRLADYAPAHEALARVALHHKDVPAAVRHLRTALRVNAFYRVPATRLAMLHLAAENTAAARELLLDSLRLGTDTWVEHHLLGDAYSRERNWQRAADHLAAALRAAPPDQRPTRALLARVYLAQGRIAQARSVLS